MDFAVIAQNLPLYLQGTWVTLQLLVIALASGLLIALPVALLRASRNPLLWVRATSAAGRARRIKSVTRLPSGDSASRAFGNAVSSTTPRGLSRCFTTPASALLSILERASSATTGLPS